MIGKSVNVRLMWLPTALLSMQAMEKDILCSSSCFFWQGCFASGDEWTGLLLCSHTPQLLNEFQVEGQSYSGKNKSSLGCCFTAKCGNFVLMIVQSDPHE